MMVAVAFPAPVIPADSQNSFVWIQGLERDFLRYLKCLKPEFRLEGMYLWGEGGPKEKKEKGSKEERFSSQLHNVT